MPPTLTASIRAYKQIKSQHYDQADCCIYFCAASVLADATVEEAVKMSGLPCFKTSRLFSILERNNADKLARLKLGSAITMILSSMTRVAELRA